MADEPDNTNSQLDERPERKQVPPGEKTGQIPLLDDVVYNTSLPFAKPKPQPRPATLVEENAPRPTDLFGGSPETATSGPFAASYDAKDMDAVAAKLRNGTEQVVDNLVAEYSQEIVGRLRKELTTLLDELNDNEPKPDSE